MAEGVSDEKESLLTHLSYYEVDGKVLYPPPRAESREGPLEVVKALVVLLAGAVTANVCLVYLFWLLARLWRAERENRD